jgi:hypothetical protein
MPQTIYQQAHHAAGSAPDTTPLQIDFQPPALRFDIAIFDNIAMLALSSDGVFFTTEREMPAGIIASLDMLVQSVRIRNKVALSVARYDMNAFFSPIEVVGAPYQAHPRTP